jgi:hypothetical protein
LDGGHREDGNMLWTVIFALREVISDSGNSDPVVTFIIFLWDPLSHTLFCLPYPVNSVDLRGSVQYILLYLGSVSLQVMLSTRKLLTKLVFYLLDPT